MHAFAAVNRFSRATAARSERGASDQLIRDEQFQPPRAGLVLAMQRSVDAKTVRTTLLEQHDWIRREMAECHALATRLELGEPVEIEFDLAVARLRSGFNEHNRTESEMLIPLLLHRSQRYGTRGTLLAERMVQEHLAEHEAFWELLRGSRGEVAANLDELMAELDAHMAAEERTFLSPVILGGDAIGAIARSDAGG